MLERLREALRCPVPLTALPEGDWLRLGDTALEAGASMATIQRWALDGERERREATGEADTTGRPCPPGARRY